MRRRLALVLAAALLAAVGIACKDQPADLGCTPEPGPRLVLRGDSLGAMIEGMVEPDLIADHDGPVCYWAVGSTQINNHLPALPLVGPADCVLMELGTNDLLNEVWATARADLHRAADELVDARAQVWFTLNPTGAAIRGGHYQTRVAWFNAELLAMAENKERWPNLLVWRWDLVAEGHPEWLNLPDNLHHNAAGNVQYEATVRAAAQTCPFPEPPPSTTTTAPTTTPVSEAVRARAISSA